MQQIVNRYFEIGTVKWKPTQNFSELILPLFSSQNKLNNIYEAGKTYYGIPFSHYRNFNINSVLDNIENMTLDLEKYKYFIPSTDCSGAVLYAYGELLPISFKNLNTHNFLHNKQFSTLLNNLCIKDDENSFNVARNYGKKYLYTAYSQIRTGDVLSSDCIFSNGFRSFHTRFVTGETKIKKDKLEQIDGNESYVIISEIRYFWSNTNNPNNIGGNLSQDDVVIPFIPNKKYTDITSFSELKGQYTKFCFHKKISFNDLYNNCYIPLRVNIS